ncbi:MAG: hypothetical protein NZ578_10495 [Candidatus Binatia bacterium]|nr:hypothetical protein [Candidatus Binatia bacterium]
MLSTAPIIAGISFPFCLMNAAGALSTSRDELLALAHSESGAIVTKSITLSSVLDPGARCGRENPGVRYYLDLLPEVRRAGKPIVASVAGFTVEDCIHIAQALATAGADLIEINCNDPHVHTHLAPFASPQRFSEIVSALRRALPVPLAVKLPSSLPLPLVDVAAVLLDAGVPAVIAHNTSADSGLTQAQAILQASGGRLEVIGVGGVSSGTEAVAVLRSGVKAIQIGSAVVREGVGVFARLKRELADSLELQG